MGVDIYVEEWEGEEQLLGSMRFSHHQYGIFLEELADAAGLAELLQSATEAALVGRPAAWHARNIPDPVALLLFGPDVDIPPSDGARVAARLRELAQQMPPAESGHSGVKERSLELADLLELAASTGRKLIFSF